MLIAIIPFWIAGLRILMCCIKFITKYRNKETITIMIGTLPAKYSDDVIIYLFMDSKPYSFRLDAFALNNQVNTGLTFLEINLFIDYRYQVNAMKKSNGL